MLKNEDIRIRAVVSHRQLGSGQIVDVDDDQVMVDFASDPGQLMSRDEAMKSLSRLRDEGLEARLVLAPEETKRWVEDSPLRLVAAALVDVGRRRTKTKDIREKLSPAIVNSDSWSRWWGRVQNTLKDSSQFDYDSRNGTRLRVPATEVDSVSFSELSSPSKSTRTSRKMTNAATRLAEWLIWVQTDRAGKMPGGQGPPDSLIPIIKNMPATITPRAVKRLADAVESRVLSAKTPPKSAPLFIDSLVAGLYRWSELRDAPDVPVGEITALAARLLEVSEDGEHERVVKWFADYASKSSDNARISADAILHASRKAPDGTRRLLSRVHKSLDKAARIVFWQQLIVSSPGQATRPPVEQWFRTLTPEERCEIVSSILVTVRDDSSVLGIDSFLRTEWKLANTKQRHRLFDAIALSWLLRAQLLPDTETIIQEVAESLDHEDQERVDSLISNPWNSMIQSAARIEVDRVREDKDQQIAELRVQLQNTEADLERTAIQKRYLQGELHNASRVAVLDITRDAIIILGDALQGLATSTASPDKEVSDVKDKITLALSTLGTEPFGEAGQVVPFEPGLHEVQPPPATGVPVRITAPGLRFFKGVDSPLTMIRIQAQIEE